MKPNNDGLKVHTQKKLHNVNKKRAKLRNVKTSGAFEGSCLKFFFFIGFVPFFKFLRIFLLCSLARQSVSRSSVGYIVFFSRGHWTNSSVQGLARFGQCPGMDYAMHLDGIVPVEVRSLLFFFLSRIGMHT